jgi:hypothetical protein
MGIALENAKAVVASLEIEHRQFSQGDIVSVFPLEHQLGVCFGLSHLYQGFQNGRGKEFFQLTPDDFKGDVLVKYVSHAQNWQFRETVSAEAKRKNVILLMKMYGYAYVDEKDFEKQAPSYEAFTDFIGKSGYHSIIDIPMHCMAAVGRTFGLKFFDPNIGEVSAKTNASMCKFFEKFFSGAGLSDAAEKKKFRDGYLRSSRFNPDIRVQDGDRATLEVLRFKL